jgi:NADPH-dependent 2,4-dienoyl-CoA reductase/sulfur reductase-like enzyme
MPQRRIHNPLPGNHFFRLIDESGYSICGLPYFLSGETPDWRSLAHRTEFPGINVLRHHRAESIDVAAKTVAVTNDTGEVIIRYDRLVIATGATPVLPALPGSSIEGVFSLHTMDDSFAVHTFLKEHQPKAAVLVGAGYTGLEMADALTQRGLDVTLLSRNPTVLPTVDPAIGAVVGDELRKNRFQVVTGVSALGIEQLPKGKPSRLPVADSKGGRHAADLVLVAVGVRPDTNLAYRAGVALGRTGAIAVSRRMETNLADVFAAGDCVETYHRLLKGHTYTSLGTIAHKQGRVAGENAIGGERLFAGVVGTQSLKVFDLAIARTGLLDHEARRAGFDPLTLPFEAKDHKAYYPGAVSLSIRIAGDRSTGALLGAQILGARRAEISKRIDIFAAALFQNASVEDLNEFDLRVGFESHEARAIRRVSSMTDAT